MTKAQANRRRYALAPTWQEITAYMKRFKIKKMTQFEHLFGLPANTLSKIKKAERELPAAYWHYVFESLIHEKLQERLPVQNLAKNLAPKQSHQTQIQPRTGTKKPVSVPDRLGNLIR